MGYIGGGGTIMGANPVSAIGQYLPGAAGGALNTGLATGVIGAGVGKLAGMSTQDALKMGLTSGLAAGAMKGLQNQYIDGSGRLLSPEEGALRDDVFRRAMAGDKAAEQAVKTGDYSGFRPVGPAGQVGQVGTTGTAQDLVFARTGANDMTGVRIGTNDYTSGQGLNPTRFSGDTLGLTGRPGGANIFTTASSYGPENFSAAAGGTGATTNYGLSPAATSPELGLKGRLYAMEGSDFSRAVGGTGATTNYSLLPRATTASGAAAPTGFIDRAIAGAKDIYNEYLSPSRPGLPADAGILRKYGPLVAAGTAVVGAAGGMKGEPANPSPLYNQRYTSDDYMRDNPDKFRGGLDKPVVPPPSGLVNTPSYATRDISNIPISLPGGITQSPAGVAQPYNVSGLYGVPLLYGPPPGRAKGGEMTMADFPRKTGPINGPGTGTSDSIPAMLSDGEFVFTAKAVRNAGNGSRRKGAARMYKLMKMLEGGAVKGK